MQKPQNKTATSPNKVTASGGDSSAVFASVAVHMAKYVMPDPTGTVTPAGDAGNIANWGLDNLFPAHSIMHSKESTTNGAILRAKSRLASGKMLILSDLVDEQVKALFPKSSSSKFTTCTMKDYTLHGCFTWLITYTQGHDRIAHIQHVDVSTVRKLMGKDGDLVGYQVNPKWTGKGKVKDSKLTKTYPVFDPEAAKAEYAAIMQPGSGKTAKDSKQVQQLYFFENYEPGCPTYPYPEYFMADRSIQFEIEFDKWHLHGIRNGFRPQVFMEVIGLFEEEEVKKIESGFKKASDPEGATGLITFTGDASGQHNFATKVTEIAAGAHDAKFLAKAAEARQSIITAHGLTSPVIAGLSGRGTLGGNGQEIDKAYTIFHNTCIAPIQVQFLECLEEVLTNGGIATEPQIIRLDPWEEIAAYAAIFAPEQIGDGGTDEEGSSGANGNEPSTTNESGNSSTTSNPNQDA